MAGKRSPGNMDTFTVHVPRIHVTPMRLATNRLLDSRTTHCKLPSLTILP